ncbi:uracil phosphoribosyltransferase, partial [Bifidobacterium longum subsp. longum]|uniref:uracil phosphoribosyltransferase n=1 Tax=Bifidobacterium longum TaxID=216816 RepID=UPI001A4A42D0
MELHVLNHPLIEHKLTVLRDKNTPSSTFRELVSELVSLEAYEATRNLEVVDKPIETPVAPMVGKQIAKPRPIIVPVLRAGLGMLDGMTPMIPTAPVPLTGSNAAREPTAP